MNCESPKKQTRWPLVRVQVGHDVQVELLSGDWLRLATHYAGRTFLCTESESCPLCPLCPSRFYWYLPVLVFPMRRPGLCEFSACTSSDLEQRAKMLHGSLGAGLQVRLARKSAKKPVYVEVTSFVAGAPRVEFFEWASALMAVYGLPALLPDEGIGAYGARVEAFIEQRAEVAATKILLAPVRGVKGR